MTPFLFLTDLDHTLVGEDNALVELNAKLSQHRQEHGTKIVYATGRSPALYKQLRTEQPLLEPDALIASVGTEIYHQGSETPDSIWSDKLSQGWDRDAIVDSLVHFADLVPQSESEQRPFKISYYLTETAAVQVVPRVEALLQERGVAVKLVYSGGRDLDILPKWSDKGLAMQYLRHKWGFDPTRTVVCGDSGNDIALFNMGEERGIIVGNAQRELRWWNEANPAPYHYLANGACAAGILEGLYYFGFLQ